VLKGTGILEDRTLPNRPYTMAEVCEFMGVTRLTIMKWVRMGAFPQPFRVGRRLYWRPIDLEQVEMGRFGAKPGVGLGKGTK
jgi:predicted DNA-binding transcriptional regulator AlpA